MNRDQSALPSQRVRGSLRQAQLVILACIAGFLLGRATLFGSGMPYAVAMLGAAFRWPEAMPVAGPLFMVAAWGGHWLGGDASSVAQWDLVTASVFLMVGRRQAWLARCGPALRASGSILLAGIGRSLGGWGDPIWWPHVLLYAIITAILAEAFSRAADAMRARSKSPEITLGVLLVLLGCLAGMRNLTVGPVPIDSVFSIVVVLAAAWLGGSLVGCAVGVMVGVAGMLAAPATFLQAGGTGISLAMSGAAAGIFRSLGRYACTTVFCLTLLTFEFLPNPGVSNQATTAATAVLVAAAIFVGLPLRWLGWAGQFLEKDSSPLGGEPQSYQWALTRILALVSVLRDVENALRVGGGTQLAATAASGPDTFAPTAGHVLERVCRDCERYRRCWETDFFVTYNALSAINPSVVATGLPMARNIPHCLSSFCAYPGEVMQVLAAAKDYQEAEQRGKQLLQDGRRQVVGHVEALSKALSLLGEELMSTQSQSRASPTIALTMGHARLPKRGAIVCGDSFLTQQLEECRHLMIISDGMGTGREAAADSQNAVAALKKLIEAGYQPEAAMDTVNSMLTLRSFSERFTTIDLAVVDLVRGAVDMIKMGAAPTVIKRRQELIQVHSDAPPAGILTPLPVRRQRIALYPGDWIIMASDGLWEHGQSGARNGDRLLEYLQAEFDMAPQQLAEVLVARAIEAGDGEPKDDMTVLVARVQDLEHHVEATGEPPAAAVLPIPVRRAPQPRSRIPADSVPTVRADP